MIYIYKDRIIRLEWTILKGTSNVKEDFSRALVKLFLIGPADKYLLDATAENGVITAMVPEGLPEGNYSVEVIYAKNWGNLRSGDAPTKPMDERFNDRCLMRSRKDDLFGITNYESEADNVGEGEVVVSVKSSVATYGYDGLNSYELAVMRGTFIGSESAFIALINNHVTEHFAKYVNSIQLEWNGSAYLTRISTPIQMRRKGLMISYVNGEGKAITEKCVFDADTIDAVWGVDSSWQSVEDLVLGGELFVSPNGTWVIDGVDSGINAVGLKGDNGISPLLKTIDNKLHYSYDGKEWLDAGGEHIAAWFRWSGNKIQISRDNKTWEDFSGEFADNLFIKGYVATFDKLPADAVQGDIWGVGPRYAAEDTENTNPIYRYWVRNAGGWVDNGEFTSIKAGIVQKTGDGEGVVMSQKAVTEKLGEVEEKVDIFELEGKNNALVTKRIDMIKGGNEYEIELNKTSWDISGITLQQGTYSLFSIAGVLEQGGYVYLLPHNPTEFPNIQKIRFEVPDSVVYAYFEYRATEGECIKVSVTDLTKINKITRSEMPSTQMSLWFDDVYTSETNNLLDVQHPIFGVYAIEEEGIHFLKDDTLRAATSRLIPIDHLQGGKITISGVPNNSVGTKIVFLKDADFSSAISLFNVHVESRTVDVPNNARYAIVTLRAVNHYDYKSIKLSNSGERTDDVFVPKYIGNIHDIVNPMLEGNLAYISKTSNQLNTSEYDEDLRVTNDKPYFTTQTYGAKMAKPIFVRGQKYVTIKSNSKQPNVRWVAWTTDTSRTEESVISVVEGLPITTDNNVVIRTLEVPEGAIYMYYTLMTAKTEDDNWLETTISYGKSATDESYESGGDIFRYKDKFFFSPNKEETDLVYVTERERVYKNALPFSVGSPSKNLSFDNQYERCNLIFFTDSHIDLRNPTESLSNVKQTIQFANEGRLQISALVHTGDFITPFGRRTKADVKGVAKPFFDALKKTSIPSVFAIGNHDNNDWNNTPDNIFRADDWGEMWLNYAEENYGIVRQAKADGTRSTWHYLDLPKWKIRIISVDAQDIDHDTTNADGDALYYGGNSFYISNEQMLWLANTALNITEDGWGVIVCLHQTYSSNNSWYATSVSPVYESSIKKMMDMLVAFAKHESYNQSKYSHSNSFYNLDSFSKDFSFSGLSDKPRLICVLNGHEHFDRVDNYNGINVIWTSNNSATTVSSDARVARILGTSTQNLFDVVNIDTKQHKLRFFRFGANMNCYGEGGDRFVPDGLDY